MAWQTPKVDWDLPDGVSEVDLNRIEGNIDYLNQTVTTGKTNLKTAIKTMGQTPASTAFADLVSAILNISKDANASVSEVIAGKTFYQGGSKKTGTMTNNSQTIFTPTTIDQAIEGYYPAGSKVLGDADLVTNNIRDGVNIFGVEGAFDPLINLTSQEFTVATGEVIDYYDLVDIVEGKVIKHVDGTFSKQSIPIYLLEEAAGTIIVKMLSEEYGIFVHRGIAYGIRLSGDTVEIGTYLNLGTELIKKICKLTDTKALVLTSSSDNSEKIYVLVLNTSTLAITVGSPLSLTCPIRSFDLIELSFNTALITYADRTNSYYPTISILLITGTSISIIETEVLNNNKQCRETSIYMRTSNQAVVVYTNSYDCEAVIVDIISTSITVHSPSIIDSGTQYDRMIDCKVVGDYSYATIFFRHYDGFTYYPMKAISFELRSTSIGTIGSAITIEALSYHADRVPSVFKMKDGVYRVFYLAKIGADWYSYRYCDVTLSTLTITVGDYRIWDGSTAEFGIHPDIYPDRINDKKIIIPTIIKKDHSDWEFYYDIGIVVLYDIADGISLDAGEGGDTVTVKLFA